MAILSSLSTTLSSFLTQYHSFPRSFQFYLLFLIVWSFSFPLFYSSEWIKVYILLSILFLIFLHLHWPVHGEKKNTGNLSAYAAFNRDAQPILGTFTAQQFDAQLRHQAAPRASPPSSVSPLGDPGEIFVRESKYGNSPCPCGSGQKFKRCCSTKRGVSAEEKSKRRAALEAWRSEWT